MSGRWRSRSTCRRSGAIAGDREELLRLFENLIENALKYGASGGKVIVSLTSAMSAKARPEIRVTVCDFGPGIAPEHLPRLTERFYRVDVGDSRAQGGTGLGLSLVKHILNRHGGPLAIESGPKQGATFTACFPRRCAYPAESFSRIQDFRRVIRPSSTPHKSTSTAPKRTGGPRRAQSALRSPDGDSMKFLKTFVAAGLMAASTSAFAADISGAGATFPYPIYAKWADAYKKETGVGLNYQSIGSGGGIKQIQAKTVTFGATDMPLKAEELDKNGLIQWPMVMGAIVPVVNIEGIKPGELVLDGPTLAHIYLGEITKWDDAAIKKLNPKLKLPSDAIAVVHRSDGSGTTFNFTDYLSKVSADWKSKVGQHRGAMAGRHRRQGQRRRCRQRVRPRARSATSNTPMPSRTR